MCWLYLKKVNTELTFSYGKLLMFYREHIIFYVSSAHKKCKQIEMCSSHKIYTITAMSLIEERDLKTSVNKLVI